ncbi:daughter-specific expression- protein [Kluyveromyces marxianus]|nr:daughter-specific expression- protein [Kluyveromyces marxianus]
MGRHFRGQRISSDIDFVRPSSMILTGEDLANIPDAFEQLRLRDESSGGKSGGKSYGALQGNGLGTRLSRKFGGTIKLKKRLSSVPELLLHEISKDNDVPPLPASTPTMDPKVLKKRATSSMNRPLPPVEEIAELQQNGILRKPNRYHSNVRNFSSPLSQPPICGFKRQQSSLVISATTEIAANPKAAQALENLQKNTFAATRDDIGRRPFLRYRENKNKSEVLLEEIVNLYTTTGQEDINARPELKQKIDDFIDTIHESLQTHKTSRIEKTKRRDITPIIVKEEYIKDPITEVTIPQSPELRPASILEANISSPEYNTSGGSDPSSGGEEFSDLDSIPAGIRSPTSCSDESFYSCAEEPTKELGDIPDLGWQPNYSPINVKFSSVVPKVVDVTDLFGFSDGESESSNSPVETNQEEYIDMSESGLVKVIDDTSSSIYSQY